MQMQQAMQTLQSNGVFPAMPGMTPAAPAGGLDFSSLLGGPGTFTPPPPQPGQYIFANVYIHRFSNQYLIIHVLL